MSTRRKNVAAAPAILSWDEADALLAELRDLAARNARLEADKELAIQKVRVEFDDTIKVNAARAACIEKGLEAFAVVHRKEFGAAKSRKLSHGVIGFQLGKPALKPISKWTWGKVLEALFPPALLARLQKRAERLSPGGKYVRIAVEVNRQAIQDAKLTADELRDLGLKIDQPERFYREIISEPACPEQGRRAADVA